MLATLLLLVQAQAIPVDAGWTLDGPTIGIERHRDVASIRVDNGRATRRDLQLMDGSIEFDVEMTDVRSFVYLQFRMESDTEFEEIYLRPHKSELPDAVQYNPVWRGDSYWQLWHGPGGTAGPRFELNTWTHVRLDLQGAVAALYLDRSATPAMVIPLARTPRSGYVAVRASTPDTSLLRGRRTASFANFRVRRGALAQALPAPPAAPARELGDITRWQVSPGFAGERAAMTELPAAMLEGRANWPSYNVERSGVLAIGRHQARPRPVGAAIARLVLRADREQLQRLYLGYSDYVTVFVNGRPVFAGDAHYSFDEPRQEGLIARSQATVWLPLRPGENEILLAVVDSFGGWALMGRLEPADGARLLPAP